MTIPFRELTRELCCTFGFVPLFAELLLVCFAETCKLEAHCRKLTAQWRERSRFTGGSHEEAQKHGVRGRPACLNTCNPLVVQLVRAGVSVHFATVTLDTTGGPGSLINAAVEGEQDHI